jgi:hypothetical protein
MLLRNAEAGGVSPQADWRLLLAWADERISTNSKANGAKSSRQYQQFGPSVVCLQSYFLYSAIPIPLAIDEA